MDFSPNFLRILAMGVTILNLTAIDAPYTDTSHGPIPARHIQTSR
jgi:hypothetical protein